MSLTFPAGHPFAKCPAAPSFSSSSTSSLPNTAGPLPPRRRYRPSPTPVQNHIRASSSSSTSNASYLFLTPSSRSSTPTESGSESEDDFLKRLSSTSTLFGTSSRRSSQSTATSDFESFAAGIEGARRQFGSTGRRGGMELSERHERAAEVREAEVEEAELKSAVRAVYVGRAL